MELEQLLSERSKYTVALVSRSKKRDALRRFRVEYGPHSVVLQERGGGAAIQIETGRNKEDRRSTKTADWLKALEEADRVITERVQDDLEKQEIERGFATRKDPDVGTIIDFYVREKFPGGTAKKTVSYNHARRLERVFAIVETLFGRRRPVSYFDHGFVEEYVRRRTEEGVRFPAHFERENLQPGCRTRHAIAELRDFSGVLNYAAGKKKIARNPLEGYGWKDEWLSDGDLEAVEHMEEAHTRRYSILVARPDLRDPHTGERLQAPVDRIPSYDGGARLRCFTALCFHHGHRPVHVASLYCGNVALTAEETKALLGRAPNHRVWWAEHFPHGGVLWESSKEEYIRFTPFSRAMRKEMDRWRELHPDWRPDGPLFPMLTDPSRPTSADRFREWTSKALEIARRDLVQAKVLPAKVERWLAGETVYGFRGHWATIMDRLGYGWTAARDGQSKLNLHKHVAFLGDWKIGGDTMDRIYAKLHPGILQAIMEFDRARDVIDRFSREAQEELDEVLGLIYEDMEDVVPITRVRA